MSGFFQTGETLDGGAAGVGLNVLVPGPGQLLGGSLVAGTVTPIPITIGSGLSLVGNTLNAAGSGGTVTDVATAGAGITGGPITGSGTLAVEWNGGTVTTVGAGLSLSSGTLTASGSGGSVTSVVAGAGLAGGTITTAGTISLGAIAATSLLGNAGTVSAVPGTIAVGSGLSLSTAGTLTATAGGGGSVTSVATSGAGITGGPITTSGTLAVEWNAGTVSAVGDGLAINSGTLVAEKSVQNGLTATGSTQAGALTLTADVCVFSTVAAGTGGQLATAPPIGFQQQVISFGTNALSIYPAGTVDVINNGSTAAAVTVAPGGLTTPTEATFLRNSASTWVAT